MKKYIRQSLCNELLRSISGRQNLIQAIVGPRQVGKTTLALQLFKRWKGPKLYESADELSTPNSEWISTQWNKIRAKGKNKKSKPLIILDEVQKIPNWSEAVKKLFDEDRRKGFNVCVILLGSAALLMQRGLTESLAGRFELHRHYQWDFNECNKFFKVSLKEYLYFGGYPGALPMRKEEERWARYIRDSLIETVLSKDILLLSPITKPVLLRQAFGLAVSYPAQILSYQKMLGTLQDAGNTTTIASYLQLLSKAFLLALLERWSGSKIRQKGSTPKLVVLDNGIISSMSGQNFKPTFNNKSSWGRLLENAIGAQLYFLATNLGGELFYWKERDYEVDYILKIGNKIWAIEVKSRSIEQSQAGLSIFKKRYGNASLITISSSKTQKLEPVYNINIDDFFRNPKSIFNS
ncbi:MAG: ATP-binding protein [Candidatus Melainabacteria bacterium]|nr:ATP-binding protein [Candidatus Melainabacteria bacterium]